MRFKTALVGGMFLLLLPFGCVSFIGYLLRDEPIKTTERKVISAPSGTNKAVLLRREQRYFLGMADWIDLAIENHLGSALVGRVGFDEAKARWLDPAKLLVTLHDKLWTSMSRVELQTQVMGVAISYHLADNLHAGEARDNLRRQESSYASRRLSRGNCQAIYRNWAAIHDFYAWARTAADNGDPDPGPWISNVFPTDCSTLPDSG